MTERLTLPEKAVGGLLRALGALPWSWLSALGAGLGVMTYLVAVRARRVARINIALCFPELSSRARERLVRRHFVAMGRNALTTARLWWASEEEFYRRVRIVERASYDDATARGQNIIFLAPHFLGLEIGGLRVSIERPCISMYRAPASVLAQLLLRRRSRFGGLLWRHDAPLRPLIRAIQDHKPFYYLPDLDPGGAQAVVTPFFGVPTPTLTALARIARLSDAVVLPCYTRKLPGAGGFEVTIGAALAPFPTDDILADATRMNAAIEQAVRKMPEQYLWTYKRFKRVCRDGKSPYE